MNVVDSTQIKRILKTCLWMSARMSVCPDPASVPSLARGDGLHEQVLTSLPMCQMSEDDLSQNPQFSKLLSALCQHMDETGLTIQLKKKLQKFYETLEQCLLVTQCVRELDPSSTTAEDKPQLLGLSKQNVLDRMPSDQDAKRMRQRLELLGCIQILQSLILDHRLRAQNDLDRKKTQYMEAKCQIIILKIRMEMLQVQLDTYTPKKIAVHHTIRDTLESALKSEQVERQSSQRMLSSFEILGKDFEAVVKEYSRLRQEIKNRKWALQEFSQYSH
ncbi:UNVERIFIED_CONTAM: hypothetical protein FKN15_039961 [Acipenser sinensis]